MQAGKGKTATIKIKQSKKNKKPIPKSPRLKRLEAQERREKSKRENEKRYPNRYPEKASVETEHKDTGQHYRFTYKGIRLDPARIVLVYEANHPMQRTIIKKSLCAGDRGKKSLIEDIDDIISAAVRWKEMLAEDEE